MPDALPPPPFRVLVFMPIGREHSSIAADKCDKLTSPAGNFSQSLSLFLAHYDDSRELYKRMPWYSRVTYAITTKREIKIVLARKLLLHHAPMRTILLRRYSHVWVTDDDVTFPGPLELRRFFDVAARLDAAILQPATRGSVHGLVQPDPSRSCAVARSTDFVEFQSPFMERCVFAETVGVLHQSTHSDYGLDMIWCRWLAAQPHSRWNLCNVCAIVDAVDGFEKRYGDAHVHSYNTTFAVQDDRRMREAHAAYDSLCAVVGACRGGESLSPAATHIEFGSAHRRMPYQQRTCTSPRPGLRVDGPCGAWRAKRIRASPNVNGSGLVTLSSRPARRGRAPRRAG